MTAEFNRLAAIFTEAKVRKLLTTHRASHDINSLSTKLNSDGSVPGELTAEFNRLTAICTKAKVRRLLTTFRTTSDIQSLASKLNSDGSVPGELTAEFDRLAAICTKEKVRRLLERFAGGSKAKKSSDDVKFAANLSLLKEYKAEEKHCNVPRAYKKGTVALGSWVDNLRAAYKNKKMNVERSIQLQELGFVWDLQEANFAANLSLLKEYSR